GRPETVHSRAMAARYPLPPYKNLLLVTGGLLVLLGIGNWAIGALRTRPHAEFLQSHPEPRLPTENVKAELLEPPDDQRQERDVARAKLEFYQLVQSGGRLLVLIGAVCLISGWATRLARRYPSLLASGKS
ncbi:MAG: hypothetical protein ACREQQ_11440, partial [Candidatus Binatia bacterium]